jgi:glutamate synthase domain-containing protein 2
VPSRFSEPSKLDWYFSQRRVAGVTKGLAKTIRAMADGTLESQVGARICNGLGIMRACLETQKLEQLEARMDEIADRVARNRTNAARERTSHP